MALVDSKRPGREAAAGGQDDGPPLPLLRRRARRSAARAGASASGFIGGRGEEHPNGRFDALWPPEQRARYGIHNATRRRRRAGAGRCMTMVMNHYKRPKRFYVRTKVWYTTEPRQQVYPLTVGNCAHLLNGMSYDVPGGGAPGSTFVGSLDVDGAVQRAHPRRRLAPSRRRAAPDAAQRDVRPDAVRRQGLLRRRRPPVQHDPPDPARAGADRERDVPHAAGHPGDRRGGARARGACTPTRSCTWPRWASGCCRSCATTASPRRAGRCRRTCAR